MRTAAVDGPLVRDEWLSRVLALPVFRVDTDRLGQPADARAIARAGAGGGSPGMYYAKIPCHRLDLVNALQAAGFSLVETAVTFVREGPADRSRVEIPGVVVGECAPAQAADVLDIAGSCFRYSRFHVDPRVPLDAAHRVKREWIRSYTEGRRGVQLLAATADGRTAGFLAVLAPDSSTAVIDLIGVAESAQRRGVGRALVAAFLEAWRGRRLQVGTQLVNIPSIRLYERMGFVLEASQYVLHRHTESVAALA